MDPLLLDLPAYLESPRLWLRPYQSGDGHWLHRIYQANRRHLAGALAGLKSYMNLDLTDPADAEVFVRRMTADWISRQRFVFGLWLKKTDQYVGEIWIECRDWELGVHEIGYFLVEAQLGQGLATEAAKAGLAFIFDDLQASKAALTCAEDNVPSYRIAERCGFVREGCLRAEVKGQQGTVVGKLYYGMLKAEWES